ncbi:MAG: rhodanese-like domain-containing protein [Thermoleophilia bacterium]
MRSRFGIAAALMMMLLLPGLVGCGSGDDSSASSAATATPVSVDPAAFKAAISRDGVRLIDVRTPAEFAEAHIEGAELIDIAAPDFARKIDALPRDGEYALYCRSANRSGVAMQQMQAMGFTNVYDLAGGITAWQDAGLPVVQ